MSGVARYVSSRAVGDGQRFAPRVVGVPGQHVAGAVGDPDNIPLPVEHIVIGAPVVQEGIPRPRLIEHVQQAMAARVLPVQPPVDDVVICHHAAHRFLGAQSAFVVQVRGRHPVFRQARQLPPVPPRHGQAVPVTQRVADPVVGDGLPGVACQQILPRPVRVSIGRGLRRRAQRPGDVGVLLHRQDIPARVVGIGEALVLCRAVRPHQPLGQIVGVPRPLGVHHVLVQPHQPIRVVHRVVPRVVGVIVIIVLDDRPVQTVVFVVHPLPVPVQRRRQPVPVVVAVARQRLRGDKDGDRPQGQINCGRS